MGVFGDLLSRFRRPVASGPSGGGAGIVDYLNLRRPQRARRLFTALFAPVLAADDPVLLLCPRPVPGLVRRADLAGLWAALEASAFTGLTAGVQGALDAWATDTLLDEVLRSPEALAGQRRMRDAALRVLGGLLGGDGDLTAFLERLNRERLAEARRQVPGVRTLVPLGRPFLVFVLEYLAVVEHCSALLAACVADAETTAGRLAQAVGDMRGVLERSGAAVGGAGCSELVYLVPLTALHAGRQYGAVALMLRDQGWSGPVAEALLGHFSACCACLGERVASNAGGSEDVLGRLTLVVPALLAAGALDDAGGAAVFRADWRRLAGVFGESLATASGRADAPELLRLIGGWHQLARTYDQEVAGIEGGLAQLSELVEARKMGKVR